MKTTITYSAKGIVLGNMWGGGKGSYPSIEIYADTKKELDTLINEKLADKSLDRGAGFENLLGAVMEITIKTDATIHGKIFTNKEYNIGIYGNITEEEVDSLTEQYYNQL